MNRAPHFRRIVAAAIAVLAGGSMVSLPSFAQSQFLGDQRPQDAAFDHVPHRRIKTTAGIVTVSFAPGDIAATNAQMADWVKHAARVVSDFYGYFPVSSVRLLIVPVDGRGVKKGTTWGSSEPAIRLLVGQDSRIGDLDGDWQIVHEMIHLALPVLDDAEDWYSEGLATYFEPLARTQAGDLSAESIWTDMARDMPKGLPRANDGGLNDGDTKERKYWGGALFCLVADIEIRRQTGNRVGLQDAMRSALDAGANRARKWPIDRVLMLADRGTQTDVLTRQYAAWAHTPVRPDLDALWKDLGVVRHDGGKVTFDDTAKFAAIRRAMTHSPTRAERAVQ